MIVQSTQKDQFTPGETALLQTFANQAALAIQRAGLVDDLRGKITQLEAAQVELVQKERIERELELARQLSSSYEKLADHPSPDRKLPAGLERPSRQLEPFRSAVEEAIASPAQREQREMASFHLDRARRLVEQEHDREAEAELRRAIYLSPYNADAHLLLGRVYLRTGRVTDAIGALKISIWSQDTAPARVALGEAYLRSGDHAAAREQAQRALALAPDSAEAKALLARVP
jgi:tetratricopeptide (TPR) repeat protein